MKGCEKCSCPAKEGERFCTECKKHLRKEMRDAGYLKNVPRLGSSQTQEEKENIRETKYGRD